MLLLRLHAHQWPCTRLGVRGRRRRCRPREELLHRGLTGTERWRLRSLLGPRRLRGSRHHHLERDGGSSTLRRGGTTADGATGGNGIRLMESAAFPPKLCKSRQVRRLAQGEWPTRPAARLSLLRARRHGLRRFQTPGGSGFRNREAVPLSGAGRQAAAFGLPAEASSSGGAAAADRAPEAGGSGAMHTVPTVYCCITVSVHEAP